MDKKMPGIEEKEKEGVSPDCFKLMRKTVFPGLVIRPDTWIVIDCLLRTYMISDDENTF